MAFRIAHISDSHLAPEWPRFDANFGRVADSVRTAAPDIVISTGDVSLDGADRDAHLHHACEAHASIGLPWHALPGNHDVGDDVSYNPRQPADAARVARWEAVFGPSRFAFDVPGWRVIGLDSLIISGDTAANAAQVEFVAAQAAGADGRRIALFTHKPLFIEAFDEDRGDYWTVPLPARRRLHEALGGRAPALVGCGHVHQWRDHLADGFRHIWAPAIAFVVGDPWQEVWGTKVLGWVEHALHPDGTHDTALRTVDGMTRYDIGEMPEVYGPQRRIG
jgi:3',5'-cyclic AMP phosphodiesterase CpdA